MRRHMRLWLTMCVLCGLLLSGFALVGPVAVARTPDDLIDFRPRLDSVTEPQVPPGGNDPAPGDHEELGDVAYPNSDWPWVSILIGLLLGGAGTMAAGLLFREPIVQAALRALVITFGKGNNGRVEPPAVVVPEAPAETKLEIEICTASGSESRVPSNDSVDVDKLRRAGFSDEAIAHFAPGQLAFLLSAWEADGLDAEAIQGQVVYMNTWAHREISGEAEQDQKTVNTSMSTITSFIPVVGDVKDLQEAVTGEDWITGDELALWERGFAVMPFVGGALLRKGADAVEALGEVAGATKHLDELDDVAGDAALVGRMDDANLPEAVATATRHGGNFSRKALAALASFESEIAKHLPPGLSLDDFNALRLKSADELTDDEILLLMEVRDKVAPITTSTLLQKVISSADFNKYIQEGWHEVRGFVTRAQDVNGLRTSDEVFEGLRLDYPGTKFKKGESVYAVRFRSPQASAVTTAYGGATEETARRLVGADNPLTVAEKPFSGNGFTTSAGHIIPEFYAANRIALADGAEIYEITSDGREVLRAVFDASLGRFVEV